MTTDTITDVDDLEALAGPWSELLGRADASPTVQPRWYLTAARTLHADEPLQAPVVMNGADVTAVVPVVRTRSGHLEVIGSRLLHEPVALAHQDGASLAAAVDGLMRFGRPAHLGRLTSDGEAVRCLTSLPRHRGLTARRASKGTPFVPIHGDWASFEASLSSSRRSSLRRNVRRADEAGGFGFEVRSPEAHDVDHELDDFVATEHRSWKGPEGTSLAADPLAHSFYRAYARSSAEAGELRVARLTVGGRLAGVQLAIERSARLWILKLGYDEELSACAPGIVLTHETLRWAFERGLEGYELLGDEAPWTRIWTDQAHPFTVVRLYPASPRGMKAAVTDVTQHLRKRGRAHAGSAP